MKRLRALVVDDSAEVVRAVSSYLKSMNHDFDVAVNQAEARVRLEAHTGQACYDYVLLDLAMPFEEGDAPWVQTGLNVLREIRANEAFHRVAVVIMSGNVKDGPDRTVEAMHLGADEVIAKPFAEEGKTLDKAILSALERRRKLQQKVVPFEGGELVHCGDHIELCGVPIIGDQNFEDSLTLLMELARARRGDGTYAICPPKRLAERLATDPHAIHRCVHTLRNNIRERLLEERGLVVGQEDVIRSASGGYCLTDWIHVAGSGWGTEPAAEAAAPDEVVIDGKTLSPEQVWALVRMRDKGSLFRRELQDQFQQSKATAARELKELRDLGLVELSETLYSLTESGRQFLEGVAC